jgi:hypothetical protein
LAPGGLAQRLPGHGAVRRALGARDHRAPATRKGPLTFADDAQRAISRRTINLENRGEVYMAGLAKKGGAGRGRRISWIGVWRGKGSARLLQCSRDRKHAINAL